MNERGLSAGGGSPLDIEGLANIRGGAPTTAPHSGRVRDRTDTFGIPVLLPPPPPADRWAMPLVLILCAAMLSPLLNAGFITDDFNIMHITTNGFDLENHTLVETVEHLGSIFVRRPSPNVDIHRPFVLISYLLNLMISGPDPLWFEATNLLLHLLAGWTLFVLLRTLAPTAPSAVVALGTAVFLLSPLQLEVAAWSAARSDSMCWIFGGWALIVKYRNPRHLRAAVVATLFSVFALLSKESGLAILGGLGATDLIVFYSDLQKPEGPRRAWRALACRAAPLVLAFVAFALMRHQVLGTLFGRYTSKQTEDMLRGDSLVRNVLNSLGVFAAPVSRVVLPGLMQRLPYVIASLAATAAILAQCSLRLRGERLRLALPIIVVMVGSFVSSVLANPATFQLVGTRALYTPLGCFILLAALAATGGGRAAAVWAPVAVLAIVAVALHRRSQEPHLEAAREIRATLESIWKPMQPYDDGERAEIALLGYSEEKYFGASFDMEVGITKAVRYPCMRHNYDLLKIVPAGIAVNDWQTFDKLFTAKGTDKTVVFTMSSENGTRVCRLATPGRIKPTTGEFKLLWPIAGAALEIGGSNGEKKPLALRFLQRGFDVERFTVTVYTPERTLAPYTIAANATEFRGGEPNERAILVPVEVLEAYAAYAQDSGHFAWSIAAEDETGRMLANTNIEDFRVQRVQ